MAGPVATDTPDYQRATVNAQVQLAAPGAHVPSVTVGVPPNAESLIVTNLVWSTHAIVQVRGVTTGALYPGVLLQPGPAGINTATWVFDIAAALDTEVTIAVAPTPLFDWFVYADGGVHLTSDASALRSGLGQGYVIPSAPSPVAGDHPPVELQYASGNSTGNGVLVGAPGIGERYRIFAASLAPLTSGSYFTELAGTGGPAFITATGLSGASMNFHPSGIPLGTDASISIGFSSAGDMAYSLSYTVETV